MTLMMLRFRFSRFHSVWGVMILAAILSGSMSVGLTYFLLKRPPVVLTNFSEDDSLARVGGDLHLRTTKQTNQICRTRIARWLWQWDPTDPRPLPDMHDKSAFAKKNTIWLELHSAPDAPPVFVAKATYTLRLQIIPDDHIEPGFWFYLGEASDDCGTQPRLSLLNEPILISAATQMIIIPSDPVLIR